MKDLINLKEKHYRVDLQGKMYVVNGVKYPIDKLVAEKNIEIHPISKVGIINYSEVLKVNSSALLISGRPLSNLS